MRQIFIILFLFLIPKATLACCVDDDRTLTEKLYSVGNNAIFTCEILTTQKDNNGNVYSTAKLVNSYFGAVKDTVLTLRTGNVHSSVSASFFPVGQTMLIYSNGKGNSFSCGGSCDRWTKVKSSASESEIAILKSFAKITKKSKSGKYEFFYDSGVIAASGTFKKGKPVKVWKHYFPSGKLKLERNLDSKQLSVFYENGFLKMTEEYDNDTLTRTMYSEKREFQKVQKELVIQSDSVNLLVMNAYTNEGVLSKTYSYNYVRSRNGWTTKGKTGTYLEYYPTGEIKVKGDYYKDQPIGLWTWYLLNGTVKEVINYDIARK